VRGLYQERCFIRGVQGVNAFLHLLLHASEATQIS
jgi:hypothetical protein